MLTIFSFNLYEINLYYFEKSLISNHFVQVYLLFVLVFLLILLFTFYTNCNLKISIMVGCCVCVVFL